MLLHGRELTRFAKTCLGGSPIQRDLPGVGTKDLIDLLSEYAAANACGCGHSLLTRDFLWIPDVQAAGGGGQRGVAAVVRAGYYSRVRNLQRAAQEIVAKQGEFFRAMKRMRSRFWSAAITAARF